MTLELLAPAKDKNVGIAAIDCGADAVYIGGPSWGNRKAAGNSLDDIRELCEYAHRFGVRIYLTVNTIVYDDEWPELHSLMLGAQDAGVDAFIIRDERIASLPGIRIPLHASTQCAIRDAARARELEALGCTRLILERGLSFKEIAEIREVVDCELEFFVHGALCVCYSGECRLSEYLDGRSADRGECIQACRSLYDLVDASGHTLVRNKALLSLRDFKLLDRLGDLAGAGICSFKIEGRLKNASYVKNVVREYSMALDELVRREPEKYSRASFGRISGGFAPDSDKTFNRGYTQWWLDGRRERWSSMDAPKSMGEYIGQVASVRPSDGGSLRVTLTPARPGLTLANGDGFAFVRSDAVRKPGAAGRSMDQPGSNDSAIAGFRGDRCEGLTIFCKRTEGLQPGVRLYRNINAAFEREIEARTPRREVAAEVDVRISGSFVIELTATTEDGRSVTSTFHADVEKAENRERAEAMIREQLGKRAGEYSFSVRSVDAPGALPLLSASTINSMRRLLAEDIPAPVRDLQSPDLQSVTQNRLCQTTQSVSGKSLSLSGLRKTVGMVLGAALFGLALSMQIKANHPQISYYLAIMILIYVAVLLVSLLKRKESLKGFWIASALLLVLGLAGIGTNAIKLMPTAEYTPYSMRGGTSTQSADGARKGLDIDYATAWSYGWEELPNIAIPNYNGGSSAGPLSMDSETVQLLKRAGQGNLKQVSKHLPTYWGPQPFTAGPMYMGAVTVFLFILGLFWYKGKERWWALIASLLAVLLALGSHFLWFTKLFYDFVPLYNKFRTVSMALVVLQFTLPVLGFLMLDGILRSSDDKRELRRKVGIAGGVSLSLILLLALLQSILGAFTGAADAGQPDILVEALIADRYHLLWADTLRSLLLVAGAVLLLLWGAGGEKPSRRTWSAALVCVLVLADLFFAGKRYLGADDFVSPKSFQSQFDKRPVDEIILRDTDPSYRVLDLTVSVFNDSHPSYWHKNIGGYSPAKLQRYQEYIDARIQPDLSKLSKAISGAATVAEAQDALPYLESLSSLNCRYIIVGENNKPLVYPYARGNAWFENGGPIELTSYAPDRLEYSYSSEKGGLAVFSEVYYPAGWVARLDDGTELPVELYSGGADEYGTVAAGLLRCIELPAGEHSLVMSFEPVSYSRGEAISRACSILLILLVLGAVAANVFIKKEN